MEGILIFCLWMFLSVAAGLYAVNHRNRNFAWFFVALCFSPFVAFVLLFVISPVPNKAAPAAPAPA